MERRRVLVIAGLGVAAGLAFLAPSAQAQTRLRYAHVGSEGDIQYWFAEEAAKKIPQATENRVAVQVFPNSQLGGVQEMIDGVKSGAISIGHHEFASPPLLATLAVITLFPELSLWIPKMIR